MTIGGRRPLILLFLGDILAFVVSLYLTLWLRYMEVPSVEILSPYVLPFSLLFIFWALVFYSVGLYSKRLVLFSSRLPDALVKTQLANIVFAALFFFLIPAFGIAPKTILALYLLISLAVIFFWRLVVYSRLLIHSSREQAVLLTQGAEADELFAEVNRNPHYGVEFCSRLLPHTEATVVVVDRASVDTAIINNPAYKGEPLIAFEDMYEDVFDRVPLSELGQEWFRENVAPTDPLFYALIKRGIDIVGGLLMGVVTLVIAPLIFICNKVEGAGPLFIKQERFGRHGVRIVVYKFRSMEKNIVASGQWTHEGENRVTKVGAFLRQTSLDEFPQCINVVSGALSLIGPRSDIRGLGIRLSEALPYYEARYSIVPGITGWAQVNQQYEPGNVSPQSIEETKTRLAYDFYYLKHRSLILDIIIALRTIKRMFFRLSSW